MNRIAPLLGAAVIAVGGLVGLGATSAAGGVPDYGGTCTITVTPPQITAGAQLLVQGDGFQPSLATTVVLDAGTAGATDLADVTTDAQGDFSVQVTIPANTPAGPHAISAVCDGSSGSSTDSSVQVLGGTQAPTSTTARPVATGPAATARTGSDVGPQVAGGVAALGLGAVLVATTRRRRTAAAA